jgi:hypothetical protein
MHVSMTSVALAGASPFALLYMTHMNIDYDGAGNAYGPDEKDALDYLRDAGQDTHYYGLMSVKPTAQNPVVKKNKDDKQGFLTAPDGTRVLVDPRYPDAQGYLPVVQQSGTFAGFFVSTTSKPNPDRKAGASQYDQSYYLNSAAVAYCALSSGITTQGIGGGDFGFAIRHDTFATASFNFLSGEGSSSNAVGECSYKVFLDIGGTPKQRSDPWANNNFPTCFVVFPGSKTSPLLKTAFADNPGDLAAFMAIQGQVDAASQGASGLDKFHAWVAGGRKTKPPKYDSIAAALQKFSYAPDFFQTAQTAARVGGAILDSVGRAIP